MYIEPNSLIYVLKNVPIDSTYRDTIFFNNTVEQRSFFSNKNKYIFSEYTYVRKERILRVDVKADDLYDCNYIMFQNQSFGQKWFYAFITKVEYVSNESSNISFEIDVMQTWSFDYNIRKSFVERMHTITDAIGDNLVPDNLERGEYVFNNQRKSGHFIQTTYIVAATFDKEFNNAVGKEYMGVYSGLVFNQFTNINELNQFLLDATDGNKADGIVAMFMMPTDFITNNNNAQLYVWQIEPNLSNIDGYIPKNKKLFTWPYNMLHATNNVNSHADYMIEFFEKNPIGGTVAFGVSGGLNTNPEFFCHPIGYKGVGGNYMEKLTLSGTPICAWSTDAFKAWWAQNGGQFFAGGVTAGAGAIAAIAGAAVTLPMLVGGIALAAAKAAEAYQHYTQPPHIGGSNTANLQWASGLFDFFVYDCHITKEFAEKIDNYWSTYGYPINAVVQPNISSRPHWNFIKCADVCLTGSVPSKDMADIKNIFNTGITFWKDGNNVGNYNLDNSPITKEGV